MTENIVEIDQNLLKAAESANLAGVQEAIERGANVNATDKAKWTSLHFACARGGNEEKKLPIVELLIEKGAKVNAKDRDGWTPLWLASNNCYYKIVQLLREHGAKGGEWGVIQ